MDLIEVKEAANDMTYNQMEHSQSSHSRISEGNQEPDETMLKIAKELLEKKERTKIRKRQGAQKMNEKIAGKNKAKITEDNLRKAIEFIFLNLWSTPSVINELLGRKGSFTAKFSTSDEIKEKSKSDKKIKTKHEAAYFHQTCTKSGARKYGFPRTILTLTPRALGLLNTKYNHLGYPAFTNSKRLSLSESANLRHDLAAQRIVAAALELNPNIEYLPEARYQIANKKGIKKPDLLIRLPNGYLLAIEVELTEKTDEYKFYKFIYDVYQAIEYDSDKYFVLFSDTPRILKRYGDALLGKVEITAFDINGNKYGNGQSKFRMPKECAERIVIQAIDILTPRNAVKEVLHQFNLKIETSIENPQDFSEESINYVHLVIPSECGTIINNELVVNGNICVIRKDGAIWENSKFSISCDEYFIEEVTLPIDPNDLE